MPLECSLYTTAHRIWGVKTSFDQYANLTRTASGRLMGELVDDLALAGLFHGCLVGLLGVWSVDWLLDILIGWYSWE